MLASIGPFGGTAHAEDWHWSRGDYDPHRKMRRKHGGVAAELATYATGIDDTRVLLESPLLGFWYGAGKHFMLSVDWGMAYYRHNTGGNKERTFRFGNPMVSGYYVGRFGNLQLHAGVGMALPAAQLPDGAADRAFANQAYRTAAAARGGWNSFLWVPEALSLAFPLRFESVALKHLLLAADVTMGIPIFLHGQGAAFVLQTAGEVGYRGKRGAIGARFQLFWWAVDDTPFLDDMAQMSLEPFFRIDFGQPFLHGRLTINLDDPFGFSFDEGGVWALHLGGGTEF